MLKRVYGRRLKRDRNERRALFKGLLSSFVLEEKIKTTEQKAKAIKGEAEKMVSKARKGSLLARRLLSFSLTPSAIDKFLNDIAPRFKGVNGGYVSLVRLGKRLGDDASMVFLKWTKEREIVQAVTKSEKTGSNEKKTRQAKRKLKKVVEKK